MRCEAAAMRTLLTQLKRTSTRVLEEWFKAKLGVAFTQVNVSLKRKDRGGGLSFV